MLRAFALLLFAPLLASCLAGAAIGAAGAVVGTTGAVVGAAVKVTGAVVGAVIPNGKDEEEDEDD
jgi:hypothetical protein